MKTLYLLRHAKSSWSFDDLSDHDRPLNGRGRDDAPRMGQALHARAILPDVVLASSAIRALSTAVLVTRELGYPHDKIRVEPSIYQADVATLLGLVHTLPAAAGSALLVGHNPTFTDLANELSPASPIQEMPTAGVVCLRFAVERWADVARANAEFYFFDYPKSE